MSIVSVTAAEVLPIASVTYVAIDGIFGATVTALHQQTEAEKKAIETGSKLVASYQEQIAVFGMSARAADIERARRAEVSIVALNQARSLNVVISRMEAYAAATEEANRKQEEFRSKAESVRESLMSDQDRFVAKNKELIALAEAGELSWTDYARAVQQAAEERAKMNSIAAPKSPQALERGSAGSYQAIAESRSTQRMLQLEQDQLKAALEQAALLRQIVAQGAQLDRGEPVTVHF